MTENHKLYAKLIFVPNSHIAHIAICTIIYAMADPENFRSLGHLEE